MKKILFLLLFALPIALRLCFPNEFNWFEAAALEASLAMLALQLWIGEEEENTADE